MEKRRYQRISIKNLSVDASDGVSFFKGVISDVSSVGVCMTDLSKKLDGKVRMITVIVSGQGRNFKMKVRPKWSTYDGVNKSIGAEILNPPWGWVEFVMKFEPTLHNDVWLL